MTEDSLPETHHTLDLDTLVLLAGAHPSAASGACVMEVVSYVAGEAWSDRPACACPVIGAFLRSWNDAIWDDATRTRLLKPLVPLLVNSQSTPAVELRRSYLALDWLARVCAPAWLSQRDDLRQHAVALAGLTPLTSAKTCREAQPTLHAAGVAAWATARDAAWDAAGVTARDAAWDAAGAAAWAAAGDAIAPTIALLHDSALDLVHRMLAEGRS